MIHLFLLRAEAADLLAIAQRAGLVSIIGTLRDQLVMESICGDAGEPALSVYRSGQCVETYDEDQAARMWQAMQKVNRPKRTKKIAGRDAIPSAGVPESSDATKTADAGTADDSDRLAGSHPTGSRSATPPSTCAFGTPFVHHIDGTGCQACENNTASIDDRWASAVASGAYDEQGYTPKERKAMQRKVADGPRLRGDRMP